METVIHLDTHAVVWLYANELARFSPQGIQCLEADELLISPIVMLELEYLHETGRILVTAHKVCDFLKRATGLRVCDHTFTDVIRLSLKNTWTRDPFDRIIAAQAELAEGRLLTKDSAILKHCKRAFW